MKCFVYMDWDSFENEGYETRIVFAEGEQEALQEVAERMGGHVEDVDPKMLERREQYDKYSPGPVPARALLDDGWWFECLGCHKQVHWYGCDCSDDCDLEGCECQDECKCCPVCDGEDVFCSQACKDAWDEERRQDQEWRKELGAMIENKFPGSTVRWISGYVRGEEKIGDVSFDVPGVKHGVRWRSEEPDHVMVAQVDLDAWQRYDASRKAADKDKGQGGQGRESRVSAEDEATTR